MDSLSTEQVPLCAPLLRSAHSQIGYITYGKNEETSWIYWSVFNIKMKEFKTHVYEILEVIPFLMIIGLDPMRKNFLEINWTRIYLRPSMINEPLEIDEEILDRIRLLMKRAAVILLCFPTTLFFPTDTLRIALQEYLSRGETAV